MNQNDLSDISLPLTPQNYENIFNVYTDEDGFYFYNLLRVVNFPSDLKTEMYTVYTVETGDTWPFIAWKSYRNIKLWWVITGANQIMNAVEQPKPGTQLKIVRPSIVRSILNTIRTP